MTKKMDNSGCAKILIWVTIPVAILWLGGSALSMYSYWNHFGGNEQDAEERLTALKEAGEPTTQEELEAYWNYRDAAEREAASLVMKAYEGLARDGDVLAKKRRRKQRFILPGVEIDGLGRDAVRAMVAENGEALELVRQAMEIAPCRFEVQFDDLTREDALPGEQELEALQAVVDLHRLFAAEQVRAKADGDVDAAVAAWRGQAYLAEAALAMPRAYHRMTDWFSVVNLYRSLNRLYGTFPLDQEHGEVIRKALAGLEYRKKVRERIVFDRCRELVIATKAFDEALSGPMESFTQGFMRGAGPMGSPPEQMKSYMQVQVLDAYKLRLGAVDAVPLDAEESVDELVYENSWFGDFFSTVNMQNREWETEYEQFLANVAMLRLAEAATAIELHRARSGALPAALSAITEADLQAATVDPYVDAPLRYEAADGGYVLISVGLDRELADEPGKYLSGEIAYALPTLEEGPEERRKAGAEREDVVFLVERGEGT